MTLFADDRKERFGSLIIFVLCMGNKIINIQNIQKESFLPVY